MTLIDAIKKYKEFEDNKKFQCLIISNSYNVAFICPVYDVVDREVVVSGFFDSNLSFHNIDKKMFNINDWRVVKINKTILDDISYSNNIISIDDEGYEFGIINIRMLYK